MTPPVRPPAATATRDPAATARELNEQADRRHAFASGNSYTTPVDATTRLHGDHWWLISRLSECPDLRWAEVLLDIEIHRSMSHVVSAGGLPIVRMWRTIRFLELPRLIHVRSSLLRADLGGAGSRWRAR
jgi:hypothetical protein